MSALTIQFKNDGQQESLSVHGDLDMHSFPIFSAVMQSLSITGAGVINIDLREVTSFNSPAMGALVLLATERRARGGAMHLLCNERGAVAPMIQRARLDNVLRMIFLAAD